MPEVFICKLLSIPPVVAELVASVPVPLSTIEVLPKIRPAVIEFAVKLPLTVKVLLFNVTSPDVLDADKLPLQERLFDRVTVIFAVVFVKLMLFQVIPFVTNVQPLGMFKVFPVVTTVPAVYVNVFVK